MISEANGTWGTAIVIGGVPASSIVVSVSCASAGACGAAGYFVNRAGHHAFVVGEDNGTWGIAVTVHGRALRASGHSMITSVSCTAPCHCVAGGSYEDHAGHGQAFVVTQT